MFAALAAVSFLLVLLGLEALGPVDLTVLGFFLLALQLVVPAAVPSFKRRNT